MREQHAFTYDDQGQPQFPITYRRSATPDQLAARQTATRTHDYSPASRRRQEHAAGTHPEPFSTSESLKTTTAKQPAPIEFDEADLLDDPPRSPTSSIRWYPTEQSRQPRNVSSPAKATRVLPRRNYHWLLYVLVGVLIMLVGWLALSAFGSWWTTQTNDWTYGRPRTAQVDAVVGHGDSQQHPSHFIALNLNRQVIVIELPGGNPAKAQVYLGPMLMGDGQDLTPITVSFEDRNGDGKPDLNIHIGDQVIVFLNTGTKFISPQQQ